MATVLVIDDEEPIRRLLRLILTQAGHQVMEAADGNEGIKRLHEHSADVVVTDLVMPNKEGLETIIELKRCFPAVGIIAISGGGHNQPCTYLDLARKFGASHTLEKPLDRQAFLDAVHQSLPESHSNSASTVTRNGTGCAPRSTMPPSSNRS